LTPISREFGFDRGRPIDRYYIEGFLLAHENDIRGRVLEIGDDSYTRRFGGGRVGTADVLHIDATNPHATFVGDLAHADHLPSDHFDCFILTQTLHLVYDFHAAIRTVHRILKPGGVVLATFPGISQLSHDEWAATWYWAFTGHSARRMFSEVFGDHQVAVTTLGNVLAATAFLHGIAAEEMDVEQLDFQDPQYQMLITVHARKGERSALTAP
jgi:SAM-dependent methyltransferase